LILSTGHQCDFPDRRNWALAFCSMDAWTAGTDIATMLTGLSVLTATIVWVRKQWVGWRQERAQTRHRNWHGYVMTGTLNDWYVRLVDDPQAVTGRVVLDVLRTSDGEPDPQMAASMRTVISRDGMLARVPNPAEFEWLKAQEKARRDTGFPVGVNEGEQGAWPFTRALRRLSR
jgi:hypothetical protein